MRRRTLRLAIAVPLAAALIVAIPSATGLTGSTAVATVADDPAESGIPTPESVLGWKPCTDYKLSNYTQLTNYFQQLDQASSRLQMVNIGKTSEGRDQYMGIISSPDNLTPA